MRIALLTLPKDTDVALNGHAAIIDDKKVQVGSEVFEVDLVAMPMHLKSMFTETKLDYNIQRAVVQRSDVAIVYYGEDAAGKSIGEFLYRCGKAFVGRSSQVQLNAYGIYRDHGVLLSNTKEKTSGLADLSTLLKEAVLEHKKQAYKARGRSHAVFRFVAEASSLTVYLADGLPNELRATDRNYRLTSRTDNLVSLADRPELPRCLRSTIDRELGKNTQVFVIVHCSLAKKYRYSLVDSLRFAREWKDLEYQVRKFE